MSKNPRSVLFVCNQNSVRSPLAYALADQYAKRRIYIDSAGLVTRELDPFVAQVMHEIGYDLTDHKAKTLQDLTLEDFDLVISLTSQSYDRLLSKLADSDTEVEFWPTEDPCMMEGNRSQIMEVYRKVRDELSARIEKRLSF
ncbi:hypothetical protein QGN29_06595 [Temperatibacter marinus]|uniref:Phosphotyrosine protein phosphatase I domain-containing protein n=1 Tax=Temperatibacter marinus TaxID=1456591 RepID=A0AA52HAX1_9PROT|nr:hypothetical protein [Temperatibacter marinus]WND04042.1 hypothetical protein QGN29_06595 [Temperatibacter marinus]